MLTIGEKSSNIGNNTQKYIGRKDLAEGEA